MLGCKRDGVMWSRAWSMMALLVGDMALATPAWAEGLDRVYEVQAQLAPTTLVVGKDQAPTDVLKTNLGPNIRRGQVQKTVEIGHNAYRLGQYRMQVRLRPGPHGGYDNGTMSYTVSASLNRVANNHTVSIFTRVKGVVKLQDGQAVTPLPANRYFTGTMQIHAIAAGF